MIPDFFSFRDNTVIVTRPYSAPPIKRTAVK